MQHRAEIGGVGRYDDASMMDQRRFARCKKINPKVKTIAVSGLCFKR